MRIGKTPHKAMRDLGEAGACKAENHLPVPDRIGERLLCVQSNWPAPRPRARHRALPGIPAAAEIPSEMKMIKVTFPDGAVRDFARGTTGTTVVECISPSLAKKTVAMKWNGVLSGPVRSARS